MQSPLGLISSNGTLVPFADLAQNVDNAAENAQLKSENAQLRTEIIQLKTELSPAVQEIAQQLLDAGLNAWAGQAITATPADKTEEVMRLVLELKEIAFEPRSWNQCDRIKEKYFAIVRISGGVQPTPEQAQVLQAILDTGPTSTGPVAAKFLQFAER